MLDVQSAFERHQRIAFQFSGGRDSMVALHVLKPYWPRMKVYTLDTGEMFPETRRILEEVGKLVDITTIHGDVQRTRALHGLASDIVPVDNVQVGRAVSGRSLRLIGRYECCAMSLMIPMHQRMLKDGITLIVRGQRDADFAQPLMRSGDGDKDVELLFPIQDWTTEQVMEYIQAKGLPVANFYAEGMPHGSDCMGCTAWWSEGRAGYLRKHYPAASERLQKRLAAIRVEIDRQYQTLNEESDHV